MNKWLELLIGLILLIGAVLVGFYTLGMGIWDFGNPAWEVLKGSLVWIVAGIGALLILLGISDLKS